jgi:hypothetical protein
LVFCNRKLLRTTIFLPGPPNPYAISWTLYILYLTNPLR